MINKILDFPLRQRAFVLLAALACTFVGCGQKQNADNNHESEPPAGIKFKASKGLLVAPATAAYIGLEMGEISERMVVSTNRFTARVYEPGKASGFVAPEEAASLSVGQPLAIATETGESLPGSVTLLRNDASFGRMVEVLLEAADDPARMKPGSFVTASAGIGKREPMVSVPRSALLQTVEGWFVYTKSGERLMRAAVKVGVMNDEFAEITDGLFTGDVIAIKPVMKLWLAELQAIRGGADTD